MMYAAIITLSLILIGTLQLLLLIKKKLFVEVYITIALMSISLIYCYSEVFKWNLPPPSGFIVIAFKSLSKTLFNFDF
jgi:hypothetical protein